MKTLTTIVLLVCMLSAFCIAQTKDAANHAPSVANSTPSKEEVLKFLEVLRIKAQLTQYFAGVAKQAKAGAEEGFKHKVPDATPEQLSQVDKFAESLFANMPIDEMVDAMIPIYQKHLTKDDLDGILAFYSSPVGQKLQREQPAMMQEGMQVGGEIGRRRLSGMMQQMDDFVGKLAQEQQKSPKP
jgi:hypothetical protein